MNTQYFREQADSAGYVRHRWGSQQAPEDSEVSLLAKKDQQIKRLQQELQNQRKRADNALKMLQTFRSTHKMEQEISANTKSEVGRRLKVQQQSRKLKLENEILRNALKQHLEDIKAYDQDIMTISNR